MEDEVMQSRVNTHVNERISTAYPMSAINNLNNFLSFTARIEESQL